MKNLVLSGDIFSKDFAIFIHIKMFIEKSFKYSKIYIYIYIIYI